jgi:general secretion pathway protein J
MKGTINAGRGSGFTLLELLVALAVLGFLLAGLAQGVHFGLLAWATEARLSVGSDDFTTLDSTLRHLIEGADPGDDLDPAEFAGSRDRLEFLTALPDAVGPMRHRRMLAVLFVDGGHRLTLRWRPYLRATRLGLQPPLTETELLRGVSRMEMAFWRPGGGWVSSWHSPDLPELVRIRLEFRSGDARHWPDIVAAPLLDRP